EGYGVAIVPSDVRPQGEKIRLVPLVYRGAPSLGWQAWIRIDQELRSRLGFHRLWDCPLPATLGYGDGRALPPRDLLHDSTDIDEHPVLPGKSPMIGDERLWIGCCWNSPARLRGRRVGCPTFLALESHPPPGSRPGGCLLHGRFVLAHQQPSIMGTDAPICR